MEKLNYLAHDRLDLKYATSCLPSAVSSPSLGDMQAAKRVVRFLRKALVAWQGFPMSRPTAWRALVLHGCRLGLRQDFSKVDEWRCRDSWWWSPQLLDKAAKECCTVKLGKRAVRAHHVGHEISGDPERVDGSWAQLQCHCRDRQSERRRGHSVASKLVGLRSLWLQEAPLRRTLLTCVPKRCLETESANC